MRSAGELTFRLVLGIDIEGYSSRATQEQLEAQHRLDQVLDITATAAGLDRAHWRRQETGDGELAVLPEGVDMAKLVGSLPIQLESALAKDNKRRGFRRPLRLRLSMHFGSLVCEAPFGPAGDAPIEVMRLLNSQPLRDFLKLRKDRDLALVVSELLYQQVIKTGLTSLQISCFRPLRVTNKGIIYRGHLYYPEPPLHRKAS